MISNQTMFAGHASSVNNTQRNIEEQSVAATLMDVASFVTNGKASSAAALAPTHTNPVNTTTSVSSSTTTNFVPQPASTSVPLRPRVETLSKTIGMGMDTDASVASIKAVKDALERGMITSTSSLLEKNNTSFHIQLGVPNNNTSAVTNHSQTAPVRVDSAYLTSLLPGPNGSAAEINVQVGGLFVPSSSQSNSNHNNAPGGGTCVVVACLSVKRQTTDPQSLPPQTTTSKTNYTNNVGVPLTVAPSSASTTPAEKSSPMMGGSQHIRSVSSGTVRTVHGFHAAPAAWAVAENQQQGSPHNFLQQQQQQLAQSQFVSNAQATKLSPVGNKSMEMLAHVSAGMIVDPPPAPPLLPPPVPPVHSSLCDDDTAAARYNYKKLPPGKTPKNHKRLFVQHSYRDHSHEVPLDEELDLLSPNSPVRTPNAAFPLKLHEILAQVEKDGLDDIIGWMPHGRSFKIHKQYEFVESILPKYFVMTKKSSFLRQLNLYGFNRLSGISLDQGSYYHEKFLKGMKYLSKRMQRQKVNGNGIRAAGNPDEEPDLCAFPQCPPIVSSGVDGQPSFPFQKPPGQGHNIDIVGSKLSKAVVTVPPSEQTYPITTTGNSSYNAYLGVGSPQASFPLKLQRILDKLESEGNRGILSWMPHGRSFIVLNVDRFTNELMKTQFNQTKYSSFQRQCHMYHFQRITAGPDKGAYWHPNFQRGKPELSLQMQRTRVNGKGTRQPGNPDKEPDLYALPPLPPIAPGTNIEIPLDLQQHLIGESHSSASSGDDV